MEVTVDFIEAKIEILRILGKQMHRSNIMDTITEDK